MVDLRSWYKNVQMEFWPDKEGHEEDLWMMSCTFGSPAQNDATAPNTGLFIPQLGSIRDITGKDVSTMPQQRDYHLFNCVLSAKHLNNNYQECEHRQKFASVSE